MTRVLLVEDEAVLAMVMSADLADAGFEVVGPVGRLDRAIAMARQETFDAALLDANLHGQKAFPVADIFIERGVPFVFLTGYAIADIPERYLKYCCLQKPVAMAAVLHELGRLTAAR